MGPLGRFGWPVVAFGLAACSALVDFEPVHKQRDEAGVTLPDAGDGSAPEASVVSEAGAMHEAGPIPSELGPACDLKTHAGCGASQLCCDRGEGQGPLCVEASGPRECSACGVPCTSITAPNCGAARSCECRPGTATGCPADQRCIGSGDSARCVECQVDDDCQSSPGRRQCVANKCVQCDRGAAASDAADDQGCNQAALPICSESNECVACSSSPDNCPGDQACNGALGCLGCNLNTPFDPKNCGGTRPICRRNGSGAPQCDGCRSDSECGSSGGYCDARPGVGTGACTHACSPTAAAGANGCPATTPFCRPVAGGEFACQGCSPADCSGAAPFCAGDGARRGSCVQCRNSADCAGTSSTPVCDATSATCRARQPVDCGANSVFDPATMTCIECATNADCADTPARPACSAQRCVQCTADINCSATAAPLCQQSSHACVACTQLGSGADALCAAKSTGTFCVTQGRSAGQCGLCDPASNRGCSAPTPFCFARGNNNNNALACHECNPNDDANTCGNNRRCRNTDGIFRCTTRN